MPTPPFTAEQLEKKRSYDREWQRRRRAAKKAAGPPGRSVSAAPSKTSAKPENAPQAKPAVKELSPRAAQKVHRQWRENAAEYLLDALTDKACPFSGAQYESHRIASGFMGWFSRLDQLELAADNESQLAEIRLCIALECLRRLSGERPAGSAPALPGTR